MMLSQRGQTLLIVVFAMSLGLLVLVSAASRVVSSVARTTQTNYYQKAQAAAEGGAEVYLAKTTDQLSDLARPVSYGGCPTSSLANLSSSFPSGCIESFGESRAFMGVEEFPVPSSDPAKRESFELESQPGETIHVNLSGLGADIIRVCWTGTGTYSDSYYFYYYYDDTGTYKVEKDMFECNDGLSWCSSPPVSYSNNISNEAQADGFYSCYHVGVYTAPVALRIFTFPGGGKYKITALREGDSTLVTRDLPIQGYRIVAIGEVTSYGGSSLESKKATRKKVIVEKTFPYPADPWYDFAVTSVSGKVSSMP